MLRPLIGITTYVTPAKWGAWELEAALIPVDYVRAVERAGGRALLVPPSEDGVEETLQALDGLLFSGGSDLDPELYDQTRMGSPACGGLPCIRIVNLIGMFIDAATSATQIVGHLTTYPGKAIDVRQPFVGYKWSFLRTAVLTR